MVGCFPFVKGTFCYIVKFEFVRLYRGQMIIDIFSNVFHLSLRSFPSLGIARDFFVNYISTHTIRFRRSEEGKNSCGDVYHITTRGSAEIHTKIGHNDTKNTNLIYPTIYG